MIDVRNLTKQYDGGLVKALNGISFSVPEGEILGIMGPSGCGKSTLLNLIGALDLPTSGNILVDGVDIRDHRPASTYRAKMVGFVFQFHHLIPALSLLENVELPLYSLPMTRRERRSRAEALLNEMGLADRVHSRPPRVSGGERQRAAIARAIVNNPRIILADEPTGSIDSETGSLVLDLLARLCRERKTTMLLATHDREVAGRADRILRIRNGVLEG